MESEYSRANPTSVAVQPLLTVGLSKKQTPSFSAGFTVCLSAHPAWEAGRAKLITTLGRRHGLADKKRTQRGSNRRRTRENKCMQQEQKRSLFITNTKLPTQEVKVETLLTFRV